MSEPTQPLVQLPEYLTAGEAYDVIVQVLEKVEASAAAFEKHYVLDPITERYMQSLMQTYLMENATTRLNQSLGDPIDTATKRNEALQLLRQEAFVEILASLIEGSNRNKAAKQDTERQQLLETLQPTGDL